MANPTPAAIRAIQGQVAAAAGGWSQSDQQLADLLNAPVTANPLLQGLVNRPFGAADLVADVSPASLAAVMAVPAFDTSILPALDAPEPKTADQLRVLNQWAGAFFKAGKLSQAEFDLLAAPAPGTTPGAPAGLFNQTQPDPSYANQVSWAVATLGRPADVQDLYAARNS